MDVAYLHLVTNHIPIVGIPFALVLLITAVWLKSEQLKAFGLLAFVILSAVALGVYLLGQGGEDFVEDLAGVSHNAIEDHEKMATVSLAVLAITGIFSLFGLLFYKGFRHFRRKAAEAETVVFFPRWLIFAVLVLGFLSSGVLGYTGKLGGKIRHTEFYGGAVTNDKDDEEAAEADAEEKDENEKGRGRNRGGRK